MCCCGGGGGMSRTTTVDKGTVSMPSVARGCVMCVGLLVNVSGF